jgi:hypothetical protein
MNTWSGVTNKTNENDYLMQIVKIKGTNWYFLNAKDQIET